MHEYNLIAEGCQNHIGNLCSLSNAMPDEWDQGVLAYLKLYSYLLHLSTGHLSICVVLFIVYTVMKSGVSYQPPPGQNNGCQA